MAMTQYSTVKAQYLKRQTVKGKNKPTKYQSNYNLIGFINLGNRFKNQFSLLYSVVCACGPVQTTEDNESIGLVCVWSY